RPAARLGRRGAARGGPAARAGRRGGHAVPSPAGRASRGAGRGGRVATPSARPRRPSVPPRRPAVAGGGGVPRVGDALTGVGCRRRGFAAPYAVEPSSAVAGIAGSTWSTTTIGSS